MLDMRKMLHWLVQGTWTDLLSRGFYGAPLQEAIRDAIANQSRFQIWNVSSDNDTQSQLAAHAAYVAHPQGYYQAFLAKQMLYCISCRKRTTRERQGEPGGNGGNGGEPGAHLALSGWNCAAPLPRSPAVDSQRHRKLQRLTLL